MWIDSTFKDLIFHLYYTVIWPKIENRVRLLTLLRSPCKTPLQCLWFIPRLKFQFPFNKTQEHVCYNNTNRSLVDSGLGQLFVPSGSHVAIILLEHQLVISFSSLQEHTGFPPPPHHHSRSLQLHCFLILISHLWLRWTKK